MLEGIFRNPELQLHSSNNEITGHSLRIYTIICLFMMSTYLSEETYIEWWTKSTSVGGKKKQFWGNTEAKLISFHKMRNGHKVGDI